MEEAISRKTLKENNELEDKDSFPLWMKQLADHLKHNRRLARFENITLLCEAYLKLIVR